MRILKIEEIDGTDSAVMHIGFPHFSMLIKLSYKTNYKFLFDFFSFTVFLY